jgi:hypothetical protein
MITITMPRSRSIESILERPAIAGSGKVISLHDVFMVIDVSVGRHFSQSLFTALQQVNQTTNKPLHPVH